MSPVGGWDRTKPSEVGPGRWLYRGYMLRLRTAALKKAGHNKTATLQVTEPLKKGFMIRKQFTFIAYDIPSQNVALNRCVQWIDQNYKET